MALDFLEIRLRDDSEDEEIIQAIKEATKNPDPYICEAALKILEKYD